MRKATGRPSNYFNLRPNTDYIVLEGKAVPITGLVGRRQGSSFYPMGGDVGYMVHRREETLAEIAKDNRNRAAMASASRPMADVLFGDWK